MLLLENKTTFTNQTHMFEELDVYPHLLTVFEAVNDRSPADSYSLDQNEYVLNKRQYAESEPTNEVVSEDKSFSGRDNSRVTVSINASTRSILYPEDANSWAYSCHISRRVLFPSRYLLYNDRHRYIMLHIE